MRKASFYLYFYSGQRTGGWSFASRFSKVQWTEVLGKGGERVREEGVEWRGRVEGGWGWKGIEGNKTICGLKIIQCRCPRCCLDQKLLYSLFTDLKGSERRPRSIQVLFVPKREMRELLSKAGYSTAARSKQDCSESVGGDSIVYTQLAKPRVKRKSPRFQAS